MSKWFNIEKAFIKLDTISAIVVCDMHIEIMQQTPIKIHPAPKEYFAELTALLCLDKWLIVTIPLTNGSEGTIYIRPSAITLANEEGGKLMIQINSDNSALIPISLDYAEEVVTLLESM